MGVQDRPRPVVGGRGYLKSSLNTGPADKQQKCNLIRTLLHDPNAVTLFHNNMNKPYQNRISVDINPFCN